MDLGGQRIKRQLLLLLLLLAAPLFHWYKKMIINKGNSWREQTLYLDRGDRPSGAYTR
jgi:hypothetical protein